VTAVSMRRLASSRVIEGSFTMRGAYPAPSSYVASLYHCRSRIGQMSGKKRARVSVRAEGPWWLVLQSRVSRKENDGECRGSLRSYGAGLSMTGTVGRAAVASAGFLAFTVTVRIVEAGKGVVLAIYRVVSCTS
jgi:hypothetical protein